jgi:SAM-dependent methyltransferase
LRPGEGNNRDIDRDERRAVEKALRATGDVRSVLDVGAGNGRWLPSLAGTRASLVVALDLSRGELASARTETAPDGSRDRAGLVCGDAGALPFPTQSFDVVFCMGLMPYVRRSGRLRALREMRRVSNRWVIVQYAHNEGATFLWQRVKERLGLEARYPRNHLSSAEVEGELRKAGLGVRGFARIGGMFSRSWIVLAEAPSPDWLRA